MKALPARPGAQRRPIRPPAAPALHADDMAEGADVLHEHPGPAGVPLWSALRDFMLWVEAPAHERAGLFAPGAGEVRRAGLSALQAEPELWAPLLTLAQMTDAPARADRARLVHAVRSLARWAGERGARATRLAFTQAAALALPDQPAAALETARQARDLARHAQAETWFRRAIRLARGADWESYAWGFIGLGVLYARTGNSPAARTVLSRALRTARKRRLAEPAAAVHHHLFVLTSDAGRVEEAYEHARAALRAYGENHPRLPALAHDLACLWADLGRFGRAIPVLEAAIPLLENPVDRVMALANVVRASAGAGDRARYEGIRAELMTVLEEPAFATMAPEALLVVAHGDVSMGEWDRAEATALRADAIGRNRGEARTRLAAEAQMEAARRARTVGREVHAAEPEVLAAQGEALAVAVRTTLSRRARRPVPA